VLRAPDLVQHGAATGWVGATTVKGAAGLEEFPVVNIFPL